MHRSSLGARMLRQRLSQYWGTLVATAASLSLLACTPAEPAQPPAASDTAPMLAPAAEPQPIKKVVDLTALTKNPNAYEWFDFRPKLRKLILAGGADSEHIALLWYTVNDGRVGLHRHAKTESVYVIKGTQTPMPRALTQREHCTSIRPPADTRSQAAVASSSCPTPLHRTSSTRMTSFLTNRC